LTAAHVKFEFILNIGFISAKICWCVDVHAWRISSTNVNYTHQSLDKLRHMYAYIYTMDRRKN